MLDLWVNLNKYLYIGVVKHLVVVKKRLKLEQA